MHTTGSGPTEEHIKDVCQLSYTFNEVKKKQINFSCAIMTQAPAINMAVGDIERF